MRDHALEQTVGDLRHVAIEAIDISTDVTMSAMVGTGSRAGKRGLGMAVDAGTFAGASASEVTFGIIPMHVMAMVAAEAAGLVVAMTRR